MSKLDSDTEKRLNLTICSTNGVAWTTDDFRTDTKVNQVIEKAVDNFATEGVISAGDYRLALVVYGYANPPLDKDAKLEMHTSRTARYSPSSAAAANGPLIRTATRRNADRGCHFDPRCLPHKSDPPACQPRATAKVRRRRWRR
jgi:hypothetical protein